MKLKKSSYHAVVNFICLILLLGSAIYLMLNWGKISDQVPVHYNASGTIDRWGNKSELLIFLALGWIIYLAMATITRFPSAWNTGIHVTSENKERVYKILRAMFDTLQLLISAVFSFLIIDFSLSNTLPGWFLPALMCLVFGSIVFFSIRLVRAR